MFDNLDLFLVYIVAKYTLKTNQNYQTFSKERKKVETRVGKNKINDLKNINLFVDLFIFKYIFFS